MESNLYHGECSDVLARLEPESVHACVTDPPYGIKFMGKRWDYSVPSVSDWTAVHRVLKPGAHLVAFGGARTYHRLVCAIEDAGFEIRDQLAWIFGSGFPKSHNLEGDWDGWGTALKPAHEPVVLARKPIDGTVAANVAAYRTGALNIDGCRIPNDVGVDLDAVQRQQHRHDGDENWRMKTGHEQQMYSALGRWPANVVHDGSDEVLAHFPDAPGQMADASASSRKTQNVYGAMKRGNGREGEASANTENGGGVGFQMRPGARREDEGSAARFFYCAKASREDREDGVGHLAKRPLLWSSGTQSPGTFQAEGTDRSARNNHPTVKPTDLMRWLCRLVTPPGGMILDPFMGSGSTGRAAFAEGFGFIGIEREAQWLPIAEARIRAMAPLFSNVRMIANPCA